MPPQEGCAIYKRPPDKRSTVFFLCRKRHGYTRDFLDWPTNRNLLGFQCRKRQCYTRDLRSVCGNKRYRRSFNAASGNAIRATKFVKISISKRPGSFNAASGNAIRATFKSNAAAGFKLEVSMPQAAMLYARHEPNVDTKVVAIVSMPQAAMLYARLCLSRPA